MQRARGIPVLVGHDGERQVLDRVHLGSGTHSEDWLQGLIHTHPEILPIADIEPGFGEPVPIAREVPCGHGYIDNLYLTPSGDIVLVETKLWRNNEIRREVVAQALDYVAALTAMSFEQFEQAVARGQGAPKRIHDLFASNPEALEEPAFIDAVAVNLRRGRMLVLVLGDGIRTETEALANLLQSHAGAHFTFALVELATWRTANGSILAVPDVLARTVMIERGIVRIENAGVTVDPVPVEAKARAQSISMSDFMGIMAQRNPALPEAINAMLDALKPYGIYSELKATLSLKLDSPLLNRPANFGYIDKSGRFWTDTAVGNLPRSVWRPYFDRLATIAGGVVIDEPKRHYVAIPGRSAPLIEELILQRLDDFVGAIADAIHRLNEDAQQQ